MANTQGIPDEDLRKLLSIESSKPFPVANKNNSAHEHVNANVYDKKNTQRESDRVVGRSRGRVPRGFLERQRMIDEYEMGGDMPPSATVVRTSSQMRPPMIKSGNGNGNGNGNDNNVDVGNTRRVQFHDDDGNRNSGGYNSSVGENEVAFPPPLSTSANQYGPGSANSKPSKPLVVLSDSILERPVVPQQNDEVKPKKLSRFKMRQQQKQNSSGINSSKSVTKGGFPSFDHIPVGSLTRKGKQRKDMTTTTPEDNLKKSKSIGVENDTKTINANADSRSSISEADQLLADMSKEEIAESVTEIESMLSADTITFLKKRHASKKTTKDTGINDDEMKSKGDQDVSMAQKKNSGGADSSSSSSYNRNVAFKVDNPSTRQEKEDESKMLSVIKTEQELEEAFSKAIGMDDHAPPIMEEADEEGSELEKNSKLLRSTSLRQCALGAKKVSELLDERLKIKVKEIISEKMGVEDASQYPDQMPVALRCLLDVPSPWKHVQLIEYVLRSIHNLTILFVPREHRIDMSAIFASDYNNDADLIFQAEYMHDDVPILSVSECYNSSTTMEKSSLGEGCYATNASAESSMSDGKDFYSDPAWTLLSKMRIIPCFSHILGALSRNSSSGVSNIPNSMITSICGILAQMSLRSPGAAVAIAQHTDLLPNLISLTLEPGNTGENGFVVDTKVALPAISLLCIICRQSRSAAKSLESVMIAIVICLASNESITDEEFRLQQWCIILWRTLLRYGLALSSLSTMLPLSVAHLSANSGRSLAPEYLSAYSVICECVKIATMHKNFKEPVTDVTLSDADRETLAMSGMRLASHATDCADHLIRGNDIQDIGEKMKVEGAKLHFLASYYDASSPSDIMGSTPSSISLVFVSVISLHKYLSALNCLCDSHLLTKSIEMSLTRISANTDKTSIKSHARACSFVESYFFALSVLIEKVDPQASTREEEKISSTMEMEVQILRQRIFESTMDCIKNCAFSCQEKVTKLSQIRWVNGIECSVGKFLSSELPAYASTQSDLSTIKVILPIVQSFVYCLIGRLGRGEEARAAVLFSQDIIFTIFEDSDTSFTVSNVGQIQDVMMKQLCSGSRPQAQLDHSFKLTGRAGITSKGWGHFSLESLRSEVDSRKNPTKDDFSDAQIDSNQPLLPLGKEWAWKLLSSTVIIDPSSEPSSDLYKKTISTVLSSLEYLQYIEASGIKYGRMAEVGSKMYHLINSCLYPEMVIREESFELLFIKLFFKFRHDTKMVNEKRLCSSFITTCYQHSRHFATQSRNKSEDAESQKLVDELFHSPQKWNSEQLNLSSKDLKAIDDFVEDLSTAYIDFGAQYDSFTHAIRYLLMPHMPERVRLRILEKLKDLLHLLTTANESNDMSGKTLSSELGYFFLGGFSLIDKSARESATFLDKLGYLLRLEEFTTVGRRNGFFYFYAVGCLARSMASSSLNCECGVNSMRRRMKGLAKEIQRDIGSCAIKMVTQKCSTSKDLANIVVH
eukprot:CAMPEP_0194080532 /NCGR_PEP_ID=MMETSP0149-20130528/6541_1 /TAXON_ID=122233 /ORGANISM="Chaetoceros debilis, Strain MM31A-1" /LENGTH=1483 /DNA_ID=CAMNT_0038762277 /DNA_START=43 /DNA_END=4491 /DNA_ORIENTATION=-